MGLGQRGHRPRRDPPPQTGSEQTSAINREYDVEPEPLTSEVDFTGAFDGEATGEADQPIVELPPQDAPDRPIPRITALPPPQPAAEDQPPPATKAAE